MHKKQFEIERETKKKKIFSSEKEKHTISNALWNILNIRFYYLLEISIVKSQFNLEDCFNISRSYRNSFTLDGVV